MNADKNPGWPMFRALVGIGVTCSLLIVAVYQLTAPAIEHNQNALLKQAVTVLFPEAQDIIAYQTIEDGSLQQIPSEAKPGELYGVFAPQDRLLGYAVKAQGMGYQDTIQLLYGYSPQRQALVGIKILASRETPGLGDRIGKDVHFLANFENLAMMLTTDNSRLQQLMVSIT